MGVNTNLLRLLFNVLISKHLNIDFGNIPIVHYTLSLKYLLNVGSMKVKQLVITPFKLSVSELKYALGVIEFIGT
jgi:hypothetical protein